MNRAKRNCKMLRKGWALYWRNYGALLDDEGVFIDAGTDQHLPFYGFETFVTVRRFVKNAMTFEEWQKETQNG